MPGVVDYWGIREACQAVLQADADLTGVTVLVEEEFLLSAEMAPVVFIYLEDRTAEAGEQRLAAGTRTDFQLNFNLWCGDFSLNGLPDAIERRDSLIGKVEVALMRQRTLDGAVGKLWLTGGQLFDARGQDAGFLAWGEVRFTASVSGTTA
jgi:hypothetical protein